MKKLLVVLGLFFGSSSMVLAEDKNTDAVSGTAKSVVSNIVIFGKNLVDGASEGVTDGRKKGQSVDSAIIVSNNKELEENLSVKLLKITKSEKSGSRVEIGFKNNKGVPVRLINLTSAGAVLVIDADGYASDLVRIEKYLEGVTIPRKAGRKLQFNFDIDNTSIKEVRVLGKTLSK